MQDRSRFPPEHAGISVIDIAVHFAPPENTSMPFNLHPSPLAHAQYVAWLEPRIAAELAANHP